MSPRPFNFVVATCACGLAAAPVYADDFEGTYAGVHAGVAESDNVIVDVDGFALVAPGADVPDTVVQPPAGTGFPYSDTAGAYGIHIGHNWQSGNFVFGVEADLSSLDLQSDTLVDIVEQDQSGATELDYVSTLRGRAGFAFGKVLLFGTGGVALAGIRNEGIDFDQDENGDYTVLDGDDSFIDDQNDIGWVVGAGAEFQISESWRIRAEGQYLDFGSSENLVNRADNSTIVSGAKRFDVGNELYLLRGGLTYLF